MVLMQRLAMQQHANAHKQDPLSFKTVHNFHIKLTFHEETS